MASFVLNGHTYSLSVLSGTDGRDYYRPETFTSSGVPLWDFFFTDLKTDFTAASGITSLAPGASGGLARSTGSAWARVSGATPSTDFNAAVPYTKGGTGLTALGTTLQYLRTNAGATAVEWAGLSGGASYAIIDGSTADGLSQDAWTTRTLNAEVYDPMALVTISASAFTLIAGTYLFIAEVVASGDVYNYHSLLQTRIRNTTDSTTAAVGLSVVSSQATTSTGSSWTLQGTTTIAGSKTFELQQYSGVNAGQGGHNSGGADGYRFASVLIIKVA